MPGSWLRRIGRFGWDFHTLGETGHHSQLHPGSLQLHHGFLVVCFPTNGTKCLEQPVWEKGLSCSFEIDKTLSSEHSSSNLGEENRRVVVVTMSLFKLVQPPARVQLRHRDSIPLFCLLYQWMWAHHGRHRAWVMAIGQFCHFHPLIPRQRERWHAFSISNCCCVWAYFCVKLGNVRKM